MSSKPNSLIIAAKTDEGAFTELYTQLRPRLVTLANQVAARNAGTDPHDFLAAYDLAFMDVLKRFDPERGEFEHMLNNAIYRASAYVVRKHLSSRTFPSELCDPTVFEEENAGHDMDAFLAGPHGQQLLSPSTEEVCATDASFDDLVEQLRYAGASVDDVKAATLLAAGGYTDLEIARQCGHPGTDKAAGMWMTRLKQRLGRLLRQTA